MSTRFFLPALSPVCLVAALSAQSPAAGEKEHEEHYVRPPHAVVGLTDTVEEFSISSDMDLSVVAIREGGASGRVKAIVNDGRGLEANWSTPVVVSDDTLVTRSVRRDASAHVFGSQGYVFWLDDELGGGATRVQFNRYDQDTDSWLGSPVTLDDTLYPAGSDVVDFHSAAGRGTNGNTFLYVIVRLTTPSLSDSVFVYISPDNGDTWNDPFDPVQSGPPGTVGGIGINHRFGEVHIAWMDDSAGTMDVHYRTGVLDFNGEPSFFDQTTVSTGAGTEASGDLVIEIGGEFGWSGSDQKYVGIAYLQDDGDATTTLHMATSQNNGATFSDLVVAQTAAAGVNALSFDMEIHADTYVLIWEDDSLGMSEIFRVESDTGLTFTTVSQMSNQKDPGSGGTDPQLSPSFGAPDGAVAVFVELTTDGPEAFTAFGDQSFGGEWHDEFPSVSEAQVEVGTDLDSVAIGFNDLYYNFIIGWRQETAPGSGSYELHLGGYRPVEVHIEGWEAFSGGIFFEILHTPFQDTFGYVLISFAPPTNGPGEVTYDGRSTGFIFDGVTALTINQFSENFFFFNDSGNEGGVTQPLPLPPIANAPPMTILAASWGPFGDLHVVTDVFVAEFNTNP